MTRSYLSAVCRLISAVLLMVCSGSAWLQAQPVTQPPAVSLAAERILLTAGRSTVLRTDFDVVRIAITNPEVADAVVVQPRQILIDGKTSGTVSLIVWGAADQRQYDLVIEPGVSTIEQRLQALYPGEDIRVSANENAVILSGRVSSNEISLRAAEIASASAGGARIVNLLELPGGSSSQQVLLQVRFAEVSRRAMRELGVGLFTGPTGIENTLFRSTPGTATPTYDDLEWSKNSNNFGAEVLGASGELVLGDFLNLFILSERLDLGAMIRALKTNGLLQSLAEPNLIAYNGQEASFLAGGEIPVPVVQGTTTGGVTVQYKEYGIRLTFTPTIAGDTIRLKVRPEVSTLDFANGILLSGFRIPALSTRRAETDVELRDGQSFAIAGLLNNISQDDVNEVPGLARLPIIGRLFRDTSVRSERNELMVLITPRLVRPLNPDEVPPLPVIENQFLQPGDGLGDELQGGGGAQDAPPLDSR